MVKRKRNNVVVEKEVATEEVEVPLVRTSDEPVAKKVSTSILFEWCSYSFHLSFSKSHSPS